MQSEFVLLLVPPLCVHQVADRLETAVNKALDDGYRTGDLYKNKPDEKLVKCSELGSILIQLVA